MLNGFAPVSNPCLPSFHFTSSFQGRFYRFIAHEEKSRPRGRANDCGADAGIYPTETAGLIKAGGGLEAGFQGVDGVEGEVDCCAC